MRWYEAYYDNITEHGGAISIRADRKYAASRFLRVQK